MKGLEGRGRRCTRGNESGFSREVRLFFLGGGVGGLVGFECFREERRRKLTSRGVRSGSMGNIVVIRCGVAGSRTIT